MCGGDAAFCQVTLITYYKFTAVSHGEIIYF